MRTYTALVGKTYIVKNWKALTPPKFSELRKVWDAKCDPPQSTDRVYWIHCTIIIIDRKNKRLMIFRMGRRLT